jgi:hypothetical protein
MKLLFCPKCHTRIIPPKWILNVNALKGVTINCGVPKCKGKVKFKPEIKNDTAILDTTTDMANS